MRDTLKIVRADMDRHHGDYQRHIDPVRDAQRAAELRRWQDRVDEKLDKLLSRTPARGRNKGDSNENE